MFASLKKKLNVDGTVVDAKPASPATSRQSSRQEDERLKVDDHGGHAGSSGARSGASAAHAAKHSECVTSPDSSLAALEKSQTVTASLESDRSQAFIRSVTADGTVSAKTPEPRKACGEGDLLGREQYQDECIQGQRVNELAETATGSSPQVQSPAARSGERERLVELLNKKNEQVRALENRVQEQAAIARETNAKVLQLEAALNSQREAAADAVQQLTAEHEQRCKQQLSAHEAALRQAEAMHREQRALADQQCAETVLAAEEKCRAIAAGELAKARQAVGSKLLQCQEEVARKDRELNDTREQATEAVLAVSHHDSELRARDELVGQLQAERQSLMDTTETMSSELCSLREKLKSAQMQCSSLESELVKKHEHVCGLETLVAELQAVRNRLELELRLVQDGSAQVGIDAATKDADGVLAVRMKMKDMEEVIEEAEKRERILNSLLQEKDAALEDLDQKLTAAKADWVDRESRLVADWQARLMQMADEQRASKKAFEQERAVLLARIAVLETAHDENLDRQIEGERRLSENEEELSATRRSLAEREETIHRLQTGADAAVGIQARLAAEINKLQNEVATKEREVKALKSECQHHQLAIDKLQQDHASCVLQCSELSQRLTEHAAEHTSSVAQHHSHYSQQLEARDSEILRLIAEVQQLSGAVRVAEAAAGAALTDLERCSAQLAEAQRAVTLSAQQTAELEAARRSILDLEEQLADKGKALKVQQQRVNDLKKALQKNLKSTAATAGEQQPATDVRSLSVSDGLGNKEAPGSDSESNSSGGGVPQTAAGNAETAKAAGCSGNHGNNSPFDFPSLGNGFSSANLHPYVTSAGSTVRAPDSGQDRRKGAGEDTLLADVNFAYLRHVVLKFLVCREAEAVQLVRAITVLLHLSPQEEKLLKETLEYRMSWFGPRPHLKAK